MIVQWYPGHMTKSRRMMEEAISHVDVVIEILDARIPLSSKNPDIDRLAAHKQRVVVLNKIDLADEAANQEWVKYFKAQGFAVVLCNSAKGDQTKMLEQAVRNVMKEKIEREKNRGRIHVTIRAMIAGIPNVGKSTLINKFAGKAIAAVGNKPGVTRGKQWIRFKKDFELLDTPGILWPKFDDPQVGIHLALTGAVKDDVLDRNALSCEVVKLLRQSKPDSLTSRYKIDVAPQDDEHTIINKIAAARGYLLKGGEIDTDRAAHMLLDEFKNGKIARITLELPKQDVQK